MMIGMMARNKWVGTSGIIEPGIEMPVYYRTVRRTDENRPPFQRWGKWRKQYHYEG